MGIKLCAIAFGTLLIVMGCGRTAEVSPPKKVDSSQLTNTVITSHMEEPITAGKNVIYCSTFQLAWNELKNDIIKEDIVLQNEPPEVKILNKGMATKADISDKDYVAMAGFGKDGIVDKINRALQNKFQPDAPVVAEQLNPNDILAYAYLFKNLRFKKRFQKLEPLTFHSANNNRTEVESFGIKKSDSDLFKQAVVLYAKRPSEYIIKLVSSSLDDEILLAKIKHEATILQTIEQIDSRIKNGC